MIDYGAKSLKPVENFIGSYLNLWDRIDDPKVVEAWHAMNTWVRDIIDMAGGAYRQLINEFYKENRLKKGTLMLRGERVELKNLKANVLNVIAEADHITPPCQSEGIMDLLGSHDKEMFRVRGGHIGIMAGSGAEKTTWPHIDCVAGETSGLSHDSIGIPFSTKLRWRRCFPAKYARFARPVRDGLIVFLEGLPRRSKRRFSRNRPHSRRRPAFPSDWSLLARCCPVLHKLGQVLARDQRLAPELRRHLRGLESLAPTVP